MLRLFPGEWVYVHTTLQDIVEIKDKKRKKMLGKLTVHCSKKNKHENVSSNEKSGKENLGHRNQVHLAPMTKKVSLFH